MKEVCYESLTTEMRVLLRVIQSILFIQPEPPESPKSLKKKTATMYDAAAFENFSDYDTEPPVESGNQQIRLSEHVI